MFRTRETEFAERLAGLIRSVSKKSEFAGIRIEQVRRELPLKYNRAVDIACFFGSNPFIFIETKVKENSRGDKVYSVFDTKVIGQAIAYCYLYKESYGYLVPYFITVNENSIAVFSTPNDIKSFVRDRPIIDREYEKVIKRDKLPELLNEHLVIVETKVRFREEFFDELLNSIARDYQKQNFKRIQPTYAVIKLFNEFVDSLSDENYDFLLEQLKKYPQDKTEIIEKEIGKRLYKDREIDEKAVHSLSRMFSYVLMNKIIFYKVLESRYSDLIKLKHVEVNKGKKNFLAELNSYFSRVIIVTNDFEPIFNAGILNDIEIPDDKETLRFINRFIETLDNIDVTNIGELIGYTYESVIPAKERHQLGQFYTPPSIAEFITKWSVVDGDNNVLDPGVGSGTFISSVYRTLALRRLGRDRLPLSDDNHREILKRTYMIDTNPFPLQLSSISLAVKNVKASSTNINAIPMDFFGLKANQNYLTYYKVGKEGEEHSKHISVPKVDAVVGNPPYTRWTEIPKKTQLMIKVTLREEIRKYRLTPNSRFGIEPGIYIYWIMHATKFLNDSGKLGMIISNLWLQTDYGIKFSKFLLDNFRIKAIIDFSMKLFDDALTSTNIILLEKESSEKERLENEVRLIRISGKVDHITVKELRSLVEDGAPNNEYVVVKDLKQGDLPPNEKWIKHFFDLNDILDNPQLIKLGDIFSPARGNTTWSISAMDEANRRPDVGASGFHYLTKDTIQDPPSGISFLADNDLRDLYEKEIIAKAIVGARDVQTYSFNESDWENLYNGNKRCFLFIGHQKKSDLTPSLFKYVRWGETECRTMIKETRGGGKTADKTLSALERAKSDNYYGWYDLGGYEPVRMFAVYQGWRRNRFILCEQPVALYHGLIALIPKDDKARDMTLDEEKATLAFLNSSISQYYIESEGRRSGGGIISLEVGMAREMPLLDVSSLNQGQVTELSMKYDELDTISRANYSGKKKENETIKEGKILEKIYDIDRSIGKILGVDQQNIQKLENIVNDMSERRLEAAKSAKSEVLQGKYGPKIKRPKRSKRTISKKDLSDLKNARLSDFGNYD